MYRILLLDTSKSNNASTYRFQLDKHSEIKEYANLTELEEGVEELLALTAKNNVIPVSVIDYTIETDIDTTSV